MLTLWIILSIVTLVFVTNLILGCIQRKWEKELTPQIAKMSLEEINSQISSLFGELDNGFSIKKQFMYELFCIEKKKRLKEQ